MVDTCGYSLSIDVHSATPHDSVCAYKVLTGLKQKYHRLATVLADGGYQGKLQRWFFLHTQGCTLQIAKHTQNQKGFQVLKWRWVVERSFAWLGNFRRLSKDYEIKTSSSIAFIQLAFSKIMLNRLL